MMLCCFVLDFRYKESITYAPLRVILCFNPTRGKDSKGYRNDFYRPGNTPSQRPLLKRKPPKLPWIPNDNEFITLLKAINELSLRNRALLLLLYDGALRREELVSIELTDIDWSHREILLRPETCKNESGRVILFSKVTSNAIRQYLDYRKSENISVKYLFVSESNRNRKGIISPDMINKIVTSLSVLAGLPKLHPHTFRHARLTHMAKCGVPDHIIAQYAGHRSIETTRIYIHLSGRELTSTVANKMEDFNRWIERVLENEGVSCD